MNKTIDIGGKMVDFKFTLSAFYIFKNQFGYDAMIKIIPAVGDIISGLDLPTLVNRLNTEKKIQSFTIGEMVDVAGDVLQESYNFEMVDFLNLIWAFAKNADSKIANPEIWYGQFESFPLIDVLREFLPSLFESLGSKKKLKIGQVSQNQKSEKK